MTVRLCVFDAYGTLFDVAAAAREVADGSLPEGATEEETEDHYARFSAFSETWRAKQLGYSWLRATYGTHTDFWQVTTQALDFALEMHDMDGDDALRAALLQIYWELPAYDEVARVLYALRAEGRQMAILSNGAPDMLEGAVQSAGLTEYLDAVLSAEQVGVFKPSPAVYDLVGQVFGVTRREVLFVSSNGWDACCAAGYGFHTVWVNRRGEPLDRLPWKPADEVTSLSGLAKLKILETA
ncbi:MAG: haloacid dehalogenase type II [Pseudomonadota bacterium]